MNASTKKEHWETIYKNKEFHQCSWYQESPDISLKFLEEANVPQSAQIIDVGGGESFFSEKCLDLGYHNLTVLDISETALLKTKRRLGERANTVNWITSDIADFNSSLSFDVWHDRATFHFMTKQNDSSRYSTLVNKHLKPGGLLLLAVFSENGPEKCSNLPVKQYSITALCEQFSEQFIPLKCQNYDHVTPSGAIQNFTICSFQKKN